MAEIYTGRDIRTALASDPQHGAMYAFALKEFDSRGFTLGVHDLGWLGSYQVSSHGITIHTGANELGTAVHWAKNALRVWAFKGIQGQQLYFAETARAWAKEQSNSCPKSLGSTVDFLYLFSGATAGRYERNEEMYEVSDGLKRDLKGIFLWVYVGWWEPYFKTEDAVLAPANQADLHPDYLDSLDSSHDQTHHYAFYFYVGVRYGSSDIVVMEFLEKTHDLDSKWKKILNSGDYYLGFLGARHGNSLDKSPRFMGQDITNDLRSPSPEKQKDKHASNEKTGADPWINDENDVAHPGSPAGKGGIGRFAIARNSSFEGRELPHPNSPAVRTVDPLDIYHYEMIQRVRTG